MVIFEVRIIFFWYTLKHTTVHVSAFSDSRFISHYSIPPLSTSSPVFIMRKISIQTNPCNSLFCWKNNWNRQPGALKISFRSFAVIIGVACAGYVCWLRLPFLIWCRFLAQILLVLTFLTTIYHGVCCLCVLFAIYLQCSCWEGLVSLDEWVWKCTIHVVSCFMQFEAS